MSELSEARAIAAGATPGPWIHAPRNQVYVDNGPAPLTVALTHIGARDRREADAAHIARFDPPTVLAMLDVIEEANVVAHREDWTDPSWANPQMMANLDAALERFYDLLGDDDE